jgi:pimeloyl-ACP methyl ester carboxylesterase
MWDDERYRGGHVRHDVVDGGAHFLWVERPEAVDRAFARFSSELT